MGSVHDRGRRRARVRARPSSQGPRPTPADPNPPRVSRLYRHRSKASCSTPCEHTHCDGCFVAPESRFGRASSPSRRRVAVMAPLPDKRRQGCSDRGRCRSPRASPAPLRPSVPRRLAPRRGGSPRDPSRGSPGGVPPSRGEAPRQGDLGLRAGARSATPRCTAGLPPCSSR